MANLQPFRIVYKTLAKQEIDADLYIPEQLKARDDAGYPVIINIHGGAFMLGSSKMVNKDQIRDCLDRGWIVVVPNHRLCPQLNILGGPIQDCRDLLAWIHDGGLQKAVDTSSKSHYLVDLDHVFAFGTSSGGTLSLCLGFEVPRPVAGIFDLYGPCSFSHPFWAEKLPHIAAKLPHGLTKEFINRVFDEEPVPTEGGVSLEGQAQGGPDFSDPRQAYAFTQIANGTVMDAIFPSKEWDKIDPIRNVTASFPPTFIVHGEEDNMVPADLSKDLYHTLQQAGVKCGLKLVPGEGHTFAAKMEVGSQTWNLQRQGFDFLESLLQ
ncbi:Polyketide synthase [Pleurostoma richardsiae]|uniref:Polyketide synthase n=1 Tax=Pleurostoma richardsiae TaxID=41990 RepID=A0AA38R3D5_9PEZI|nr:Polyketide synthase [Pleurostoma richardsiae]